MFENLINDLHVPLWQWIVSQALGFLIVFTLFYGFQQKKKTKLLWAFTVTNILGFFAMMLLENYGLAATSAVNIAKNLTFIWKNTRKQETPVFWSYFILIFFLAAMIVSVSLFWVVWTDWPILFFSSVSTFGSWWKSKKAIHIMKGAAVGFQTFFIINAVIFFNIIGIINGIIVLGSILLFYIKFFKTKKKPQEAAVEA